MAHRGIVSYEVKLGVKSAVAAVEKKHRAALDASALAARKQEDKLVEHALALERIKDEEISRISTQRDVAIKRLSNRPNRPSDGATPPANPTSCTGTSLYRQDGEFLIGEAARADQIMAERDYYYKQYEDARKALNDYANSH